jgi:hypothetical protein
MPSDQAPITSFSLPPPEPLQRQVSRPLPVSLQFYRNTIIENNNKIAHLILSLQQCATLKMTLIRLGKSYYDEIKLFEFFFHKLSLLKDIKTAPYTLSYQSIDAAEYSLPAWSITTANPATLLRTTEEQNIKIAELKSKLESANKQNQETDECIKTLRQILVCYTKVFDSFFPGVCTGQQQQLTQAPAMHNPHLNNSIHSIFYHASDVPAIEAKQPIKAIVYSSLSDINLHYH